MKKKMEPWLFLLPVLVILLLLFGYPLINSIIMAFQNYKLTAPNDIQFNGLENFKFLFASGNLGPILRNTILYNLVFMVILPKREIFAGPLGAYLQF